MVLLMTGTASENSLEKTLLITKLEFGNVESIPNNAATHDMVFMFKSFLCCDNLLESLLTV